MNKYIDSAADCTVKQFMECAFSGRYRVLVLEGDPPDEELKRAFELIYDQYTDMSGLFVTREFELSAYIHSLETRINTVVRFLELQRSFIAEFAAPFVAAFHLVKKYGHKLYWNNDSPDIELFNAKLEAIPGKEAKYKTDLAAKKKELFDMQRKKITGEHNPLENRRQFITMLNRLQQARFVVDRNVTTIEDLALQIKDMKDQKDDADAQKSFKRR